MQRRFLAVFSFLLLAGAFAAAQVTFNETTYNDSGQQSLNESSGDFNRDGRPDLAVGTDAGIDIWTNAGGGKFTGPVSYAPGGEIDGIHTADVNNDGWLDLVIVLGDPTSSLKSIHTLLNNGDGTFRNGSNMPTSLPAQSFAVGDLNRDGRVDLVVLECDYSASKCQYQVFLGSGTGTFAAGQVLALANTAVTGPQLADMNGDGKLDLVNIRVPKVFVWPGTGSGTFGTPTSFQPPAVCGTSCDDGLAAVAIGDFNNDARLDLAVLQGHYCNTGCDNDGTNTLYLYKNNGGLSFSRASSSTPPGAAGGSLFVTDLNGDQNMDLILVNDSIRFGYGEYMLGKGNFAFGSPVQGIGDDADVVARDFNLDSRQDLALVDGLFPNWYEDINTSAYTNCAPPSSANLAAKICTPISGATVSSPVLIKASGNSPAGIQRLEIWVDGVKKYEKWNDQVAKRISMTSGSHTVSVVAVDLYKGSAKKSITIHVP